MTSRSPSLMRLLPELDRITFGIVNAGKSTDFRIPIGPSFHRDPARPQFRHEPIEIIDAEVDHPLLFCSSKIVGILGERPENCCPCLLLPYGLVQVVDSKILLVPLGEPSRSAALKNTPPIPTTFGMGILLSLGEDNAGVGAHMQLEDQALTRALRTHSGHSRCRTPWRQPNSDATRRTATCGRSGHPVRWHRTRPFQASPGVRYGHAPTGAGACSKHSISSGMLSRSRRGRAYAFVIIGCRYGPNAYLA